MKRKISTFLPPDAMTVDVIRKEGLIRINQNDCVRCDTCNLVCPSDAIHIHTIDPSRCLSCGQCLMVCPFDAVEQMSFVEAVESVLKDTALTVVAHVAPAVRTSLAEEFGAPPGALCTDQVFHALELCGFRTYDVAVSADQTIMEEATEFVQKVRYWILGDKELAYPGIEKHPLPHFTSCCPAWVQRTAMYHPELLPHLSTAKSPIQMGGVVAKVWGAQHVFHCEPQNLKVVAVTPCTSKIYEAQLPENNVAWRYLKDQGIIAEAIPSFQDIDYVLTVRDLAELFRRKGIDPTKLPAHRERKDLNLYTGAGTIFGTSGGVMEAALRTAYQMLTGKALSSDAVVPFRGKNNAIVEATIPVALSEGKVFDLRVCLVNGQRQSVEQVLETVKKDPEKWHFIEVMNCPGGCVSGGGQPARFIGGETLRG